MAHDVFVSYSHKDKAVADAIVSHLESQGSRCWYAPRDIAPGSDWAAAIMDAIKVAKVMVLVFTDFSNASTQVAREVNLAVSNGVTIIPFKLTESMPTEGMQYYLSTVHWLDALSAPLDQSVTQLDALVKSILHGTPAEQMPVSAPPAALAKKRPGWLIPVVALLGALAFGGGIMLPKILSGGTGARLAPIAVPDSASSLIADPSDTGTQGNYQGNYQNSAYAASDGEYFYFRGSDASLYKMGLDGSGRTQLSDTPCCSIGVIDGYIYYCTTDANGYAQNICRMKTDGSEPTTLYSGALEDLMIVGDRMYFKNSLDQLKLYSVALDGSDVRAESDISGLFYLTIWDGKMYWANDEDGRCLYRANLDGSYAEKLTEYSVDSITACGGWIFFNGLEDHALHTLNADTLENRTLISSGIYDPVVSPYGIVGQSSHDSLHLFRAETGASGGTVISDMTAEHISVVEGYVFFTDGEDGNVYVTDIYGSNLMEL